jgi:MoaA/NifB/PqqE/SkfB family radical SAM enzyme
MGSQRLTDTVARLLTQMTDRVYALPVVVLMPHSRCDCRCVMCDIWRANQTRREIGPEVFAPLVEEFRALSVRYVVLTGGEALMHPNLWALCQHIRTLPARITLLTTGMQLANHAADVARWCDDVIVSLDGDREVHDRVRGVPRAFERLEGGVRGLRSFRPSMRITARTVLQRLNYATLPDIVAAARSLTLDQISFLAADVSSTAFNRPAGWPADRAAAVALTMDDVRAFADLVERTIVERAADFASGFIAESADKLRRLPRYYAALLGAGPFPENRCNAPWTSTVIEADGAVRPCFFHRSLGSIHEQPLATILNGRDARRFRRELDVKTDPICHRCVCTLYLPATASVGGGAREGR